MSPFCLYPLYFDMKSLLQPNPGSELQSPLGQLIYNAKYFREQTDIATYYRLILLAVGLYISSVYIIRR